MQEMLSMEAIINPIMDGVNLQNMLFFLRICLKIRSVPVESIPKETMSI